MNFVHLAPGVGSTRGLVVALGTFDGVHVGHRAIVAAAKKESTVLGTDTAVLIFSASPHGAGCILPLDDRLREFRALGVNLAVVCDFDELRALTPEAFVSEILLDKLGAVAVFAGYNYRFGAKAAGDTDRLRALCAAHGIACGVTPCVELCGAPVSSTRIRALLAAGDVGTAGVLLGFRYYLRGEVLHGKQLGRTLGMPTVNQRFADGCVTPAHGVYYTTAEIDGRIYPAVSNVGTRPTVSAGDAVDLETHILHYSGDLYGKTVTVRYASGHGVNTHDYAAAFTYSDELFTKSGYTYRQDLAEMSLGLAFAAISSKDSEYEDQLATSNRNFISFAEQCGFENIRSNKWMTQPAETDSIGINCASKTIRDNGGQYTLIAVGVRGNNYHAEWGGNARLGASGEHAGFAMGRDQVLDYLRAYIAETGITGRVKLWISGYSRSASVANMVGGMLDDGCSLGARVSLSPHDLYCYCYEPPMGATKDEVQGRVYENIHNIVNTNDLVTYVAFDSWDFARYGVDRVVPTKGDANYLNYKAKMLSEFYRIPNNGGNIYWPDHFQAWGIDPKDITSGDLGKIFKVNMTQEEFYADLCEAITTCLVSSRQDYADNLQDYLIALLGDIFGAADRDTSGVAESFAKKVQDNAKKLFYSLTIPGMLKNGTAVKLLTGYLVEALKENGIVTYDLDGIRDAFATLVPRLSKMALKYPGTTMTLLANLLVIMSAHFGESCLAWMRCLSDTYMTNKQRVSYAGLFDDVAASAWYAPSVDYVKYGRLMYGTGNNLFQPDAQMTRAMFVQVLYALEGSPSVSGLSCPLADADGSWYTDAVIWAYNAGVAAGVSATEFAPNEPLTREQMVTMLYGYASRSEQLTGDAGALSPYRDQANVSAWAREAMVWAVSAGIICGTSPTTLSPQKIGTRAEVATVVMGFCEQ